MFDPEDHTSNPTIGAGAPLIGELIETRLSRRTVLGGLLAGASTLVTGCSIAPVAPQSGFSFQEVGRGMDDNHHVPPGYAADVLIKWGDHLFDADAPEFDPYRQSEADQLARFGYNNDYIGFVSLNDDPSRGLLCVNHEYTSAPLMFPDIAKGFPQSMTKDHVLTEMAAHGGSIVEVRLQESRWLPVTGSPFNRRITAHKTPMQMSGPVAGHDRLKTSSDPTGCLVAGTMNNCAGGITPWGTWLMAEENFNLYFTGKLAEDHAEAANHARYGLNYSVFSWGTFFERFNVEREPTEPNRFGWIVEVDPSDPTSTPKKRSALGRFKHEGAETVIAPDGRVVVYMGDDQRFDYVYKFVTKNALRKDQPDPDLLDDGTLFVARFSDDGFVDWLPLRFGEGPLNVSNGFDSQADVLIEARRAADLLGATPMDRPEDVQPDQKTGRVWVMLTNNHVRSTAQVSASNPRPNNTHGHIIEIVEPAGNFASTRSRWEILVQCGDPNDDAAEATWNVATSANGWFGSPDNAALDGTGRLWVATDGNPTTGAADGIWAVETSGDRKGTGSSFFRAPIGAEVCGPQFSSDSKTLFLSVQHPGDGPAASFENPSTRWPDFQPKMPPRPSVLAIRQLNGDAIGS